jgi:hypothetical protein
MVTTFERGDREARTMAAPDRQHYALQTIFSFFLGLMVLAFIGVGVNTFYPSPADKQQTQQQEIQRQMDALNIKSNGRSLDTTQQAQMDKLVAQQNTVQRNIDAETKGWARTTSIVLVIFATFVMGISLLLNEQLRVLSNGLLLGGLFTMLYGTGWVIFSGNSTARFFVIAFALAVAIALGYLKFVRTRAEKPGAATSASAVAGDGASASPADAAHAPGAMSELESRVAALEARAAAAAEALAGAEKRG